MVMPAIDMPGVKMPHFREMADVIRRAGIYGPEDYIAIVQEQIRYWKLETLSGLNEIGEQARDKILAVPARLKRIAEAMKTRTRAKTFSFEVAFAHEFTME
jgi:acyl-[acyl-carrier-protein] desaturase